MQILKNLIEYHTVIFIAVGCETFTDGLSLLILNKPKCEEGSECLGEKEISLSETKCSLLPNKTQYLHNNTWKPLQIKTGSFAISSSDGKVSLKVITPRH